MTSGGLWLTPRDYARFAYFLLHDGNWKGQQLTNQGWVAYFREQAEYPKICGNVEGTGTSGVTRQVGYKNLYPQYPPDMIRLSGSRLNNAYIFPSQDLVIIRTSRIYPSSIWDEKEDEFIEKLFDVFVSPSTSLILKGSLPGQIIQDPIYPNGLVYNRDANRDGALDPFFLCGAGDPEGFLYRGKRNPDGTRKRDQAEIVTRPKNRIVQK